LADALIQLTNDAPSTVTGKLMLKLDVLRSAATDRRMVFEMLVEP
jgi:hypothetical protein